jgi:DNA-binding NtrC family response regulator
MRVFLPADATPVSPAQPRARAAVVLVAEPDSGLRGSAAETLRGAGMQVIEATTAAQLQELWEVHADEIDAAVIDVRFSRPDGQPLLAVLHGDRPELPLLALCAMGDEPSAADREALTAYVRRPFTADALRERLAGLLAKRHARQ